MLSGALNKNFGYFIVRRKSGFYSQRSKHSVPPDGHWRFILMCAEMAHNGLYVADIVVDGNELYYALLEAHLWVAAGSVKKYMTYNFHHIINLKITFGL